MQHLISITQFSKNDLLKWIDQTARIKANPRDYSNKLTGKIVATLFFEPSTRTRLSFESAALRLGARIIGFADAATSSTKKGETLKDTIKIVNGFADIIAMRHPESGAAERASAVSKIPIINGGDGINEHPTQALLDIFTIAEQKGQKSNLQFKSETLENLNVALVGDLKFGRTVHSLSQGLAHFNPTYYFISPSALKMPDEIKEKLTKKNIKYQELETWTKIAANVDILYITRIQKERFKNPQEYDSLKNIYVLNKKTAAQFKKDCLFMHPLPRAGEIDPAVDADPRAIYFQQAHNGVWTRMAILISLLKT